jgi:hypothetical protein
VLSSRSGDLIIVGDKKSPPDYDINCEYLDVKLQEDIYSSLSIPFNHYSRKNFGYLNAILSGYDVIYDTDDDNMPLFGDDITFNFSEMVRSPILMLNVYGLYTTKNIWSRGFPHSQIGQLRSVASFPTDKKPSIVYGLCDGDTDVDAIYRITNKDINIKFSGEPLLIDNRNLIVFNSQSTFWVDPEMFVCMYLPVTVTSRFSDILRSYVTQYVLRSQNKFIGVKPTIAYQDRNAHNLYDDLQEEIFMYKTVDRLVDLLEGLTISGSPEQCLYTIYDALFRANIVAYEELTTLKSWIKIINEK